MTALIIGCVVVMVATAFIGGLMTVFKTGSGDICNYGQVGEDDV